MRNIPLDVVPPSRRSIRHIPVPERNMEKDSRATRKKGTPYPRVFLWVLAGLAFLGLIFSLSLLFVGATVNVTPQIADNPVDLLVTAYKNPKTGELGYGLLSITKEGAESATPTGEEFVEKKASGRIVVYNNFTTSPQRLIKNTRFETPTGLIYRINESIVIPGKKTLDTGAVPGVIEVTVYADVPGPAYNIGLTDFTIPGFKGDKIRFDGFYGRSKTPMSGGFKGMMKKVSLDVLTGIESRLRSSLEKEVFDGARQTLGNDYLVFPALAPITLTALPRTEESDGTVKIRLVASSTIIHFDQSALASFLAAKLIANYDGAPVHFLSSESFTVTPRGTFDPTSGSIQFLLKGKVSFVWDVDTAVLRHTLAGIKKAELTSALSNFPGILKAEAVTRPFWLRRFPTTDRKIEVIVESPGLVSGATTP